MAHQAIVLATLGADLHFITVSQTVRQHFASPPEQSEEPLREALEESVRLAQAAGVSASGELHTALYASDVLLPESRHYDLLAIGNPERSRAAGIALAGTASRLVHETEGALLVARRAVGPDEFPKNILLASDGSAGSWEPARVASQLAEAFDPRIEVVNVSDSLPEERRRTLEDQIAVVHEATGTEPELLAAQGGAARAIVETAEHEGSSLIVMGHRGLRGLRALSSVSERVVHNAPCSVLLVPTGEGDEPGA